ncbi:membrane protein [Clostridioides difficile]|nr:membrane protein [Clostridioides difficile]
MSKVKSVYNEEYLPFMIRYGRLTLSLGIIAALVPGIILSFGFGIMPPISALLASTMAIVSMSAPNYIIEPVSYSPILGIPGTYMSFLSGNISNMRLPCSIAAQKAAEVESGTEEGSIISTIGIAVSILVNISILTIGVILGGSVLSKIPAEVVEKLNLILPALFGSVFGQVFLQDKKLGLVAIVISVLTIILSKQGIIPQSLVVLICVFGTILIARAMYKDKLSD